MKRQHPLTHFILALACSVAGAIADDAPAPAVAPPPLLPHAPVPPRPPGLQNGPALPLMPVQPGAAGNVRIQIQGAGGAVRIQGGGAAAGAQPNNVAPAPIQGATGVLPPGGGQLLLQGGPLQIQGGADYDTVRATLEKVVERFPGLSAGEIAQSRLGRLKLEIKGRMETPDKKLGVYEQNIGLKYGGPRQR